MKNVFVAGIVCLCLVLIVDKFYTEDASTEINVFIPNGLLIEHTLKSDSTELKEPPIKIMSFPDHGLKYRDLDVFCLAKNIFHEARGEPTIGKYAVAQITLNRVESLKYPNNICSVVLDRYQFSWANQKSQHWTRPQGQTWEESYRVALNVLENGERVVGLNDSRYYHADYVSPKWASKMTPVTTIGRHIFYTHH
jgi:hypothetical protein